MPRWPSQQTETPNPPAPPETSPPPPQKPEYEYQVLNPYDAEFRKYPYNGETVIVSYDPNFQGFAARWRSTRKLQGWKWIKTGAWVIPLYNTSLPFDPLFWRPISNLEDLEN